VPDNLAELGRLTLLPETNIIKLPNISASQHAADRPRSRNCRARATVPDFPEEPKTDAEKAIRLRYSKCLGSAVNPVLREGNSDRRAPCRRQELRSQESAQHGRVEHGFAQPRGPHEAWRLLSWRKVHDCGEGARREDGTGYAKRQDHVLKPKVSLLDGEIIDSMFMSKKALCDFYEEQMEDARKTGVMFSLHVKATMMKVSHPIVFGHAVKIFYKEAFEKHGKLFDELGVNVNNGLSTCTKSSKALPTSKHEEIIRDMHACHEHRPELAMVDSAKGISNLHAPSDVIVDASMPAMIRIGGKMWGADGRPKDTKAVIPESTFARIYQEIINFCKTNGNFDPVDHGHGAQRRA
jgi:isocitrate dehydrogenase